MLITYGIYRVKESENNGGSLVRQLTVLQEKASNLKLAGQLQ